MFTVALVGGCITPCPFHDSFAQQPPVTTASSEGVRESGAQPRLPEPIGEPKIVFTADGTVTHRPLYFEDPREVTGSEDGQFAWTSEEYVYMFTGPIRFMANMFSAPVEMVFVPPWTVMASDGHARRKVLWWWVDSQPWDADELGEPGVMVVEQAHAPVEQ